MTEIKNNRQFGLIMTAGFSALGVVIPIIKHRQIHWSLLGIAILFLLLAVVAPLALSKPRLIWLRLGEKLGFINSRILFSFIYLTLFSFIHFIFFITKRDKLKRRWKQYSSTYFEKSDISSFKNPF